MRIYINVKKVIITTLLACCICFTNFLVAGPNDVIITKQQAVAMVKEKFGGKVLKVKLIEQASGRFYLVKLLTKKGRVKLMRVDSRTGNILHNRPSN